MRFLALVGSILFDERGFPILFWGDIIRFGGQRGLNVVVGAISLGL